MKRLIMMIFAVSITAWICAEPVSKEQALQQAQQFLLQKGKYQVLKQAETQMSKARARGKQVPDYYYVFNAGQNQGFVIVSGDDRTPEILGYSEHGSFNLDQIPSNMEEWLQGYAEQIKYVQDHQIANANRVRVIRRANVTPFLTSHWDQNSPYNDDCGFDLSIGHIAAVTGCVSVAMAQVMYYYKYPAQTVGSIPSYQVNYNGTESHTFDGIPAGTVLDWDNMLDSYPINPVGGTEVQRAAVANLLSVVGRSIQTTYSNNSSGAYNYRVADALKNYFGYAQNVAYKQRWGYNNDEWEAILYQELSSGRPIVYGGQTSDDASKKGHCFVLDGYQDGGYFHVNWGWGQLSQSPDGFFLLSAMDPPLEGAGGGSGAYNYGQDAIVGIDYQNVGPVSETVRLATTSLTVNGSTDAVTFTKGEEFEISYNVVSRLINTYDFYASLGLYQDGAFLRDIGKTWGIANFTPNGYNTTPLAQVFNLTALQNGQYIIIPISKEKGTDTWYENERSDEFFISLEVTDTQLKMTIGSQDEPGPGPDPEPEVTDAQRTELAAVYASLASSVESKQASVAANETEIAALKTSATALSSQIAELMKKAEAIEEKLKNELLTETQKEDFADEQADIVNWCEQSDMDLKDILETISTLETTNASLKTQLETISGQISTQAAAVASITTAEALAASQSSANTLKTQIDGCSVEDVADQMADVTEGLSDISPADIDTAIKKLNEDIDAAIEEAKAAQEEEQKEREKLEAGKTALKESLDALKKSADEKATAVAANEQAIATLKTAIATAEEAVKPIDTKIAAIKEKLNSTYLTDAQKTDYTSQLTALETEKATYSTALADLKTKLQTATDANTALNTQLTDIAKAIQEQADAVAGIATSDALETAKGKVEEIKSQLDGVDAAAVSTDIETLKTGLAALSLDKTSTALKTIADAIAAAQDEKEKAELEAAKKEVQTSIDALKKSLADAKEKISKGETALAELAESIKNGEETLVSLKAKAAEIETLISSSSAQTRGLPDEQVATFLKQLQDLNAKIKALEETLTALTEAKNNLEAKVKEAQDDVLDVEKAISSTESSLATAATADEAKALNDKIAELQKKLASIDTTATQVISDISTQATEISDFVTDASAAASNADAIYEDVQNTISGIDSVTLDESDIYGRYDLNGRPVDENYKGVVIIKMKNGKSQTIIKRK